MKKLLIFGIVSLMSFIPLVEAKPIDTTYYINNNGVAFTEKQYQFISKMYWEGYQDTMTQDEFDQIAALNVFDAKITKTSTLESQSILPSVAGPNAEKVVQAGRTTSITTACNTECMVTVGSVWNGDPTKKSWDVIGARYINTSLVNVMLAKVSGTDYEATYHNPKITSDGFGFSVLLPNTTNLKVVTTFVVNRGNGTVYGSYQHAVRNTTEAISNQYNINYTGYGYVFDFYGDAYGLYDGAIGVYTSLNG